MSVTKFQECRMMALEVTRPFRVVKMRKNAFKSRHNRLIAWDTVKGIGKSMIWGEEFVK